MPKLRFILNFAFQFFFKEQEQEQEQEKEKEKEDEKIEELEDEEFTRQKYSRDDEDPIPWAVEDLSQGTLKNAQLGFYGLNKFSIFKNVIRADDTLNFPEFLYVSRNHFQREWVLRRTLRRVKNVIIVMEWNPRVLSKDGAKAPSVNLTAPDYDIPLRRCFAMFDLTRRNK